MGVNHRSLDVLVTEKFLNCPDVVARFQELRGEGMTECVAGGPFGQVGTLTPYILLPEPLPRVDFSTSLLLKHSF